MMSASHLAGKTVAFTGELAGMTRAQVTRIAQAAGATVTNTVNGNTNVLVCGKAPGPKAYQARSLGVTVLSQPQFARFTKNVQVQPAAPVAAVPQYQASAPMAASGQIQYPAEYLAMAKAPRGRRPATATAAPVQTYVAPVAAPAPRGRRPRMATPVQAYAAAPVQAYAAPVVEAPMTFEAPTGPMPWETEVVGEAAAAPAQAYAAPMVRAPRVKKVTTFQAPVQAYTAPAPVAAIAVAPMAQTGAAHLAGQNVVFTGALQVNRVVAAAMATKVGAMSATGSLSAKTNLLVCGANAGEKMAKAQSMGVRCISEAEFVAACRN